MSKNNQSQLQHEWQQRLCPIMTMGDLIAFAMKGPTPRIVQPNGAQPAQGFAPTPCQGPNCMFFVDMPGPDGACHGDGACAIALNTVVNAQKLELLRAEAAPEAAPNTNCACTGGAGCGGGAEPVVPAPTTPTT